MRAGRVQCGRCRRRHGRASGRRGRPSQASVSGASLLQHGAGRRRRAAAGRRRCPGGARPRMMATALAMRAVASSGRCRASCRVAEQGLGAEALSWSGVNVGGSLTPQPQPGGPVACWWHVPHSRDACGLRAGAARGAGRRAARRTVGARRAAVAPCSARSCVPSRAVGQRRVAVCSIDNGRQWLRCARFVVGLRAAPPCTRGVEGWVGLRLWGYALSPSLGAPVRVWCRGWEPRALRACSWRVWQWAQLWCSRRGRQRGHASEGGRAVRHKLSGCAPAAHARCSGAH